MELIAGGGSEIDRIVDAFAEVDGADEIAAARDGPDVYVVGSIGPEGVAWSGIVIGDSFAAQVVVLRLDMPR